MSSLTLVSMALGDWRSAEFEPRRTSRRVSETTPAMVQVEAGSGLVTRQRPASNGRALLCQERLGVTLGVTEKFKY